MKTFGIIISCLIIIGIILIYIFNPSNEILNNPLVVNLGQKGDFLGGVLNPILTIITILILILNIKDEKDKNHEENNEKLFLTLEKWLVDKLQNDKLEGYIKMSNIIDFSQANKPIVDITVYNLIEISKMLELLQSSLYKSNKLIVRKEFEEYFKLRFEPLCKSLKRKKFMESENNKYFLSPNISTLLENGMLTF